MAENKPEVAGILRGAAYATFRLASPKDGSAGEVDMSRVPTSANFVLAALHETGELVASALGSDCRRELRAAGAAMGMEEAVAYALDHIDVQNTVSLKVQLGGEP